jgi:transposase InsO family protein
VRGTKSLRRIAIIDMALAEPQLSPRELAVTYTDDKSYFVSESSVYRMLKALDLITSPAYILMQASDKFQQPTLRVNEMWQTDFTYFKIIGWGWYYLSTVLDDYSRFIVAWRLCTSMSALDVSNTLDDARVFTGIDQVKVKHQPRLLSDNGPCYIAGELSDYLAGHGMKHTRGRPYHPQTLWGLAHFYHVVGSRQYRGISAERGTQQEPSRYILPWRPCHKPATY